MVARFAWSSPSNQFNGPSDAISQPPRTQCNRHRMQSARVRRWQGQGGRTRPPTDLVESRTPDDIAALQCLIEKLEKAIEEAQWLVEALRKARSQATLSPIGVRSDSCQAFVERARKRLAVAEEDVVKALRVKSTREFQLKQGLARLEKLRQEAANPVVDWPKLDFGQSNLGQSQCWPIHFWPIHFFGQSISGSGVCHGGAPKGWGPNPEKIGPRRVGPRRVEGPKGGAPKSGSTEG